MSEKKRTTWNTKVPTWPEDTEVMINNAYVRMEPKRTKVELKIREIKKGKPVTKVNKK